MPRPIPALICALALAVPAMAQDRNPAQQETLIALARVLGEAQALRQVCAGAADPAWRAWFDQLLEVEVPGEKLDAKLRASFETGYGARRGAFPACGPASRLAEAQAALRGRDLAAGLSRSTARVHPEDALQPSVEPMAEEPAPR